jgi:hypothetical protein
MISEHSCADGSLDEIGLVQVVTVATLATAIHSDIHECPPSAAPSFEATCRTYSRLLAKAACIPK